LGTIFDASTGALLNVVATTTINRTGTPDIIGDFPRTGQVAWGNRGNPFGNYFSQPANPNLNINSGTSGQITTKTGSRTLAGQIRLEF